MIAMILSTLASDVRYQLRHSMPRLSPWISDSDDNCEAWAASGECDKNPAYMRKSCALSCGAC